MTDDKHAKRAAHDLSAREGISYTAARRRLAGAVDREHQEPRPPIAVPIARTPCPEGCDGSGHPGTLCWAWRPADVKGGASREVRRAAELPGGRAEQLAERVERPRKATQGARWSSSQLNRRGHQYQPRDVGSGTRPPQSVEGVADIAD